VNHEDGDRHDRKAEVQETAVHTGIENVEEDDQKRALRARWGES
jgi:hypothetical protein